MEATQYAELKSARDAARRAVRKTGRVIRNLKLALSDITEGTEAYLTVKVVRDSLKEEYGQQKTARDELEAQVTEARAAYKAEHGIPASPNNVNYDEDDEDEEDMEDDGEDG